MVLLPGRVTATSMLPLPPCDSAVANGVTAASHSDSEASGSRSPTTT
jgi:hypothetical protein